ncbi:MAG: IPT/TIG domain-containing protein [Bacteroidales bacterium]|nr:IPT/TIG domain-containing protein [Bacteroidales bacterium]
MILITLSSLLLVTACTRQSEDEIQAPVIYSIYPLSGYEGESVTINGSNFSTDPALNIITLGGKKATVTSATTVQLLFRVPQGITPGRYPASLTVDGITTASSQLFEVKEKEVQITDPDVLAFNYAIGTQTIGPSYGFTTDDRLVETAKAILGMGSNILKITLSPGSYNITGRSYSSLTALVRDDPSFSAVLDMPFTYFFFWARSNSNWADGYSVAERMEDSVQIADLTNYLITKYNNSGRQFFIGHWEGDWYLLPNYDVNYIPSDTRIEGMIQWYRTRQNAVDEAKRTTAHLNVEVFTYCEVNRVVDAMNGLRRVTNFVLPYTNVDYVSYSSYDAQGLGQNDYNNVLNYIEGNLPSRPHITGKRVFIGEMGRCAQDFSFSKTQHESVNRENIRKALAWGAPFILYWEMYNNEIKDGVQRGFWLIDNTNIKWPLYETFSSFYPKAKKWVYNQKTSLNRMPTREEYNNWAYSTLSDP